MFVLNTLINYFGGGSLHGRNNVEDIAVDGGIGLKHIFEGYGVNLGT
jgi:hypothetical protein